MSDDATRERAERALIQARLLAADAPKRDADRAGPGTEQAKSEAAGMNPETARVEQAEPQRRRVEVERVSGKGMLFIADPHLADTPPGQRLPGYREQILGKVRACLEHARDADLVPVFLGDLFNWPRENSNTLLVELIALFAPQRPFVLVGNHDKYQARYTSDVSLAVLAAAGVSRLMAEPGPQFLLETPEAKVLVGATPDGYRIPSLFTPAPDGPESEADVVVWLTHHNIQFPDFPDKAHRIKEIEGVDWVVNGHIHRPQATIRVGGTAWANPGNITRLAYVRRLKERVPAASIWTPGREDLDYWPVPYLPFEEVFPDLGFPPETSEASNERRSKFLEGLERLNWRRTREGLGLKQFLETNLNPELPEAGLVWELYEEVTRGDQ